MNDDDKDGFNNSSNFSWLSIDYRYIFVIYIYVWNYLDGCSTMVLCSHAIVYWKQAKEFMLKTYPFEGVI